MRRSKILVVTKREYLSRIKTKGFWISTVALPLVMAAWMVLPSLIMAKSEARLELAVIDETGMVAPVLEEQIAELSEGIEQLSLDVVLAAPEADAVAQQQRLDEEVLARTSD